MQNRRYILRGKGCQAEGERYCTPQNAYPGGFNFKFENPYFEELLSDKRIDHTRLSFDSIEHMRKWDADNPMDLNVKGEAFCEE